jgi:hypothetical protein
MDTIGVATFRFFVLLYMIKGSSVHVAPACARCGKGSDHFGSYVHNISLQFCTQPLGLEPMASWSQGNSFTAMLSVNLVVCD